MKHQVRLIPVALAVTAILGAGCTSGAAVGTDAANASEQAAGGEVTAASLNGTYRYEITLDEATEANMVDPEDTYPNVVTVTLSDGDLEGGCFGAAGGTYEVEGDRVTFHSTEYDADSTVTVSVDEEGNLRLTPVPPMDPGDAFVCFSQVWTKIA
ncbi:MAG: hypothetical protein H0U86_09965 [Chloroflexi bacterium]|nr:hypothetical protein [Chloroflexota bacterium]